MLCAATLMIAPRRRLASAGWSVDHWYMFGRVTKAFSWLRQNFSGARFRERVSGPVQRLHWILHPSRQVEHGHPEHVSDSIARR